MHTSLRTFLIYIDYCINIHEYKYKYAIVWICLNAFLFELAHFKSFLRMLFAEHVKHICIKKSFFLDNIFSLKWVEQSLVLDRFNHAHIDLWYIFYSLELASIKPWFFILSPSNLFNLLTRDSLIII